jgi:pilus assembly protein Flp/PilA
VAARLALKRFISCRSGATAVEYGLIVTVIFLAIVASINLFAQGANTMFNHISTAVAASS